MDAGSAVEKADLVKKCLITPSILVTLAVEHVSVKDAKAYLAAAGVDSSHAVEKAELMALLKACDLKV